MKKTLFAMATLALCGTAFAATYNTNDPSLNLNMFEKDNEAVTLNVNKTVTFGYFGLSMMGQPLALNFFGSNTFSSTMSFEIGGWGSVSVTGDSTAATSWESKLLENAGTAVVITLADSTADSDYITLRLNNSTFMNASSGGSITLGNTQLTYRGFRDVDDMGGNSMDDVKSLLSDNQVFLVGSTSMSNGGGLYLVGKVAAPVPEPATATLSLMALAGLCARRRRK